MKKILLLTAACFLVLQAASFAAITITGQTGTIKITDSKGKVTIVKAGEPMPAIADGSTIQIVSGTADIGATGTSSVNVLSGKDTIQIAVGDQASFSVGSTGATTVTDIAGNISVTKGDGSTITLNAGGNMVIAFTPSTGTNNNNNNNKGAEAYTPPPVNNLGQINTNVKGEESAKDISPVK